MPAKVKISTQLWLIFVILFVWQLACLNSVPIPTPSAPVETILALTGTPGSSLPSPTVVPTITRTITPTPLPGSPATSVSGPTGAPTAQQPGLVFSTPYVQPGTPIPGGQTLISNQNLEQLVELMRFGGGRIEDVHFSWDGSLLGVETSSGRLMYDAGDLSELTASDAAWEAGFGPAPGELRGVKLSDGIYLEQAADGTLQTQLIGAVDVPAAYSADWHLAAGFLATNRIGVWNAQTGELERELDTSGAESGRNCSDFSGLDISMDGRHLAAGCRVSGDLYLWRLDDAVLLQTLDSGQDQVGRVKFSPDSRLVGAVLPENRVTLWRVRDGELLRVLDDAQGARTLAEGYLAFSPDNYYMVGGFANGELLIWRLSDGALLRVLQGPAFFNQLTGDGLAFSPDGTQLIYSSWNQVLVRRAEDGRLQYTLTFSENILSQSDESDRDQGLTGRASGAIKSLAVTSDGRTLVVLLDEPGLRLHLYRLADGVAQDPLEIQDFPLFIRTAALEDVLAVITTQGVYFYQLSDRTQLGWLPPAQNFDLISFAALSPDGSKIVLGREGSGLEVWDWRRTEKVFEFTAEEIYAAAFSPGGTLLAFSSPVATYFFQTADWQSLSSLPNGTQMLAFTPDGNLVGAPVDPLGISFFDTRTLTEIDWQLVPPARVASLAFHPRGRLLLTALEDGTLRIYGKAP